MMNQTSKFLLLMGMTVLMVGCKLAVIVVEGGEVQSTGSGTCVASAVCIIDVTVSNSSESYTALPYEGWYFEKWNRGDKFFCGDSIDPTCDLSFLGHEDSEIVEDMIASSEVFYLMPVYKRDKDIITVGGKEWLQPDLFSNLTWDFINAVCPGGTCIAGGRLRGQDMTGWTWASVDKMNALFNHYLGAELLGPGLSEYSGADPSPDRDSAYDFHTDGWRAIAEDSIQVRSYGNQYYIRIIHGWASDRGAQPGAWATFQYWVSQRGGKTGAMASISGESEIIDRRMPRTGAWFYRIP